jgi:hypothetical protein
MLISVHTKDKKIITLLHFLSDYRVLGVKMIKDIKEI